MGTLEVLGRKSTRHLEQGAVVISQVLIERLPKDRETALICAVQGGQIDLTYLRVITTQRVE